MATFVGTAENETITPTTVSPTVTATGGTAPTDDPDRLEGRGGIDFLDGGGGDDDIFGGGGTDTIIGGAGEDEIHGGLDSDSVNGGTNDDTIFLDEGSDSFLWTIGDGSDVVDGGADFDSFIFGGSAAADRFDLTANGADLRVVQGANVATIDLISVELGQFALRGGADLVRVGSLTNTAFAPMIFDFSNTGDLTTGDVAVDEMTADGTGEDDNLSISRSSSSGSGLPPVNLGGLGRPITLFAFEAADRLVVNGFGGNDRIETLDPDTLTFTSAVDMRLTLDGGAGADTLKGGFGSDNLIGGGGADIVSGGPGGDDVAILGAGTDLYTYNEGDGFDTVNGGTEFDRLVVNRNVMSIQTFAAGDARRMLFVNDGTNLLDVGGVERLDINTSGEDGIVILTNPTDTGLKLVRIDAASSQTGEGVEGTRLFLNATTGNDVVSIASSGGEVTVSGLPARVEIFDVGFGNSLTFGLSGGNDRVDAAGLNVEFKSITFNLQAGDDTVVASLSADIINAGDDVDTVIYSGSDFGVAVDLGSGAGLGGDAQDDTYSDVENASGSAHSDILGGTAGVNVLNGGGGNDQIFGRAENDTLNGGLGIDRTDGGLGDDTHQVDDAADVVIERAGQGSDDRVLASVSYTLTDAMRVETLATTSQSGRAAIDLTGNGFANLLIGNAGSNVLNGRGGADEMRGGRGDDTYIVDAAGDLVVEGSATGGIDLVRSSVEFELGENVENLILTGSEALDGDGNSRGNELTGNDAANGLSGFGGNDRIDGGKGADEIRGGPGADIILGGLGTDQFFGGQGNDDLTGGGGADEFGFDTPLGPTGVDSILDFSVVDDTILLDRAIFTEIAADGELAASAFRNGTAAADANDRIIYDAATGRIFYDADGDAAGADAILFATVTAGKPLTNADFVGFTG